MLSVFAASSFETSEFGALGLLVAGQAIVLGCARSLTSEIVVYHYSSEAGRKLARKIDSSTAAALFWGIAAGIITLAFAFLASDAGGYLFVFALSLPGLFMQDHFRQCLIACRKGSIALLVDIAFVSLLAISLWLLRPTGMATFLGIWGAVAAGAAIAAGLALRTRPRVDIARDWIAKEFLHGKYFLGDFLTTNLIAQGAIYLVALVGGLSEAAGLRGAQVLLVPILLVSRGLLIALGPESASRAREGKLRSLFLLCMGYSVACAVTCVAALVFVTSLSIDTLVIFLGDSAMASRDVFPSAALAVAMLGIAGGGALGLRALGDVRQAMIMKLWSVPITGVGVVAGCLYGGAAGSQLGLASGEILRTILNWRSYTRAVQK
ncbi:hypothetical protein [Sinomonas mesophila]|uniref:hypothetical protein n=1 Tax=Sinomonas mesophila TaxID=1531955 RepID=UPI00111579D8|nr:hypothetical protein [Sinomonas mesophila]